MSARLLNVLQVSECVRGCRSVRVSGGLAPGRDTAKMIAHNRPGERMGDKSVKERVVELSLPPVPVGRFHPLLGREFTWADVFRPKFVVTIEVPDGTPQIAGWTRKQRRQIAAAKRDRELAELAPAWCASQIV